MRRRRASGSAAGVRAPDRLRGFCESLELVFGSPTPTMVRLRALQVLRETGRNAVLYRARAGTSDPGMRRCVMLTDLHAVRADLAAERPLGEQEDVHFTLALAETVVRTYSPPGGWVLDPFAGYGTALVAASRLGRRAVGFELLESRASSAAQRLGGAGHVAVGDARRLGHMLTVQVDLCLTSPPYMSASQHPQNPLTGYRTLDGNYSAYLDELEDVFRQVARLLRPSGYAVINVADTGPGGSTPLVTDVEARLVNHLRLEQRLRVAWDDAPPGITNDTCLVFRPLPNGAQVPSAVPSA
jgi:SAM-dependent methyltransferase